MIGRQFRILPSQPPNWTATKPSALFLAVMLLSERALYFLLEVTLGVVGAD
jgi:hypothetical protein